MSHGFTVPSKNYTKSHNKRLVLFANDIEEKEKGIPNWGMSFTNTCPSPDHLSPGWQSAGSVMYMSASTYKTSLNTVCTWIENNCKREKKYKNNAKWRRPPPPLPPRLFLCDFCLVVCCPVFLVRIKS
jgi:hypothetical protein